MSDDELIESDLTYSAIGAFFEVYNTLGYGFLEHIYSRAMELELKARGHRVAREVLVRVFYKGHLIGLHRLDMVVDEVLVLENKSTRVLHKEFPRQVYNYLKASTFEIALLLHFGPEPAFYRLFSPNKE